MASIQSDGIAHGLDIEMAQSHDDKTRYAIKPGTAYESGRRIEVLKPELLEEDKIRGQLGYEDGELGVWIAHDTRDPETYQIIYQSDRPSGQYSYDKPSDRGKCDKPSDRGSCDKPSGRGKCDKFHRPYESLSSSSVIRAPVFLGTIKWDENKKEISGVDSTERRYITVSASEITPPYDGRDIKTLDLKATNVVVDGLEENENGILTVKGDVNISGKAAFHKEKPDSGDPELTIGRRADNDLFIQLGDKARGQNRLVVGFEDQGVVTEKFIVTAEGNMTAKGNATFDGDITAENIQRGGKFRVAYGIEVDGAGWKITNQDLSIGLFVEDAIASDVAPARQHTQMHRTVNIQRFGFEKAPAVMVTLNFDPGDLTIPFSVATRNVQAAEFEVYVSFFGVIKDDLARTCKVHWTATEI